MKNAELAEIFNKTADVLAIQGENMFRVLAYRKIARTLEELPHDVEELVKANTLKDVPGIGQSSNEKIAEYLRTGHIAEFEELWAEVPPGVMQIMAIPNVGPKTAALLWKEGGVTSIESLQKQIADGSLLNLKGVGEKKLTKITQNIAFLATSSGRVQIGKALPIALELVEFLKQQPGVLQAQYAGSLRRGKETIGDIDLLVAASDKHAPAIAKAFTQHRYAIEGTEGQSEILAAGSTKTSIRTAAGIQIDLRIVPNESFGAALQYFTGSKEHNVRVRELAVKKGLKLNEWGLFKGEKKIAGETEESIYTALSMATLPPEMREDKGEVQWAQKNADSKTGHWQILDRPDIKGDLHMHTTASDGSNSIEEMVAQCKKRGYLYAAITDHSKSQFQANGLKTDRLLNHIKAIHAVAKEAAKGSQPILVLAGSEVDILADGSLDYEDDILAKLDWVVASPHAALSQDSEAAAARLIRACANPYVSVIGHPTGRLVPGQGGGRKGLEPDMQKVIFAAARSGVALEINAHPMRLDLRDSHVRLAVENNIPICINTDAHGFPDFDLMLYGILTARRGWAQPPNILNTKSLSDFKSWLKKRKHPENDF